MDVMSLRRGIMAAMAQGAKYVKGTFTIPLDADATYTVNFGETFSKYMYFVEMTDASIATLLSEPDISGDRVYAFNGIWPAPTINNNSVGDYTNCYKVKPSTGDVSAVGTASCLTGITNSSISFRTGVKNSGTYYFIKGYSFNCYVVEIK